MDGHDRHHHHVGVGQDQGGLVGLERHRPQRGGEGVAAMPQPPGRVELQSTPILLGVNHEHPTGPDHQMVDIGLATRDGQVVHEERDATRKELTVDRKGVYRVEVYLEQLKGFIGERPWVISNPIHVR